MPVEDSVSRVDDDVMAFVEGSVKLVDGSVVVLVESSVNPVAESVDALVDGSVAAFECCCSASRIEGLRSIAFASSTCDGAESCGAFLRPVDPDWGGVGKGESPMKMSVGYSKHEPSRRIRCVEACVAPAAVTGAAAAAVVIAVGPPLELDVGSGWPC